MRATELRPAVVRHGGLWTDLQVVTEAGSTNAEVAAAARTGAAEGLVVVAEHQTAGRGRAGRTWSAPPRAGLILSVLLRPGPAVPGSRWGWLPLLAGVALAEAVTAVTGLTTSLKWPNDLLVTGGKCAGILAEVVERTGQPLADAAVVVGIGLNVSQAGHELPPATPQSLPATSLALAGAPGAPRPALLRSLLAALERWYARWQAATGDAGASGLRPAYLRRCATVGQPVRALLPDSTELTGTAQTVDPAGCLVLRTSAGIRTLAAADLTHLRPLSPGCPPTLGSGHHRGVGRGADQVVQRPPLSV